MFSGGSRHQARDSEQVVGSGDQVGVHLHSFASTVASFAQAADGLHPTERLLDPLADALALGIAGMARGAPVDRRASAAGVPPRDDVKPSTLRGRARPEASHLDAIWATGSIATL